MCKIITRSLSFFTASLLLLMPYSPADTLESLQGRFLEPPQESRRLTGPLFWLHGDESRQHLEMYVQKVAQGGNGCFTAESRPHNDWLGEGWYRDLEICLAAAKKNDLKMWIFDEKWWPSGEVDGRVPPQFGSKYMHAEVVTVNGPLEYSGSAPVDKHIATLAGRLKDDSLEGDTLIDLTDRVRNGKLTWMVPAGDWRILHFTWKYSEGRQGRLLVDGASREAVDWYLQTVYQPHYDRFKDDFGTWIEGFFYDEPETYGDWGTEVIPLLKERGVDWKKALTAWKFTLCGDEQTAAKYQYQDALAETWGRTLYGGISHWCRQRNVRSIGHFLEHRMGYLNPLWCAGNMFQLQKYSDMGGIDAVFAQFIMGKRTDPGGRSHLTNDGPTWQTPKLASSISHVYGKKDDAAMVEIFGARGQDLTYPEMLWWTNHMFVCGVNFHVQHSFNPRAPYDTDCPPYFYNGGFEPRWPLYRVYADYTARLSDMLSGGSHICPVALLYLGNSYHVGKSIPPEQISEALQDALYDCDWMPYDVFEKDTSISKRHLALNGEKYSILIVPPAEVIPAATLEKAKQFFDHGGIVLGYGFLPTKSASLETASQQITSLCRDIWGDTAPGLNVCKTNAAGGRSYLLPESPTPAELQQVLTIDADRPPTLQVLEGQTQNWLHVLHRQKDGRDIFFITNQNTEGGPRTFRFRLRAQGFPECWDPMRAEITSVPFDRRDNSVELTLALESLESTLIVFAERNRSLPSRIDLSREPLLTRDIQRSSAQVINPAPMPDPNDKRSRTMSPVAAANPFEGAFDLPTDLDLARVRVVLNTDELKPEAAMRITINGRSAGGCIGLPLRKDITEFVTAGSNTVRIEPFSPAKATVEFYSISDSPE